MKNLKPFLCVMLLLGGLVLLVGCRTLRGVDTEIEVSEGGNNTEVEVTSESEMTPELDSNGNYLFYASKINLDEIEFVPCIDLKSKLQEQAFLDEWGEILTYLGKEAEDTYLYNERGCYLSAAGLCMFHIVEYDLANIVRCYIFNEAGENVGEIFFFMSRGEVRWNLVTRTKRTERESDILKILSQSPEKKYILLSNGTKHIVLDENNETNQSPNVGQSGRFEIIGDCYSKLNNEVLAISYEDIVNPDNWVWVEFN